MRRRVGALDGLRGVAALVVVLHHTLLTDPDLAAPYRQPGAPAPSVAVWWLAYTPLHVVWNGTVAVFVFFVLSGYVLALPGASRRPVDWVAYYPRRLVRLYLPVAAAVALAVAWLVLVPRHVVPGASWWLNHHHTPHLRGLVQDVVLVLPSPGATNTPLWSLRWEVVFSLLLPLFMLAARHLRARHVVPTCFVLALVTATGSLSGVGASLLYLPMFGCGVALAYGQQDRAEQTEDAEPRPPSRRLVAAGVALVLVGLTATWIGDGAWPGRVDLVARAGRVVEVLAACAAVTLAVRHAGPRSVLERPVLRWLGSRSFSLYLVHEPLIVSIALLLGGRRPVVLVLALAVPLALLLAEVFYRCVERPGIEVARRVGAAAARARAGRRITSRMTAEPESAG